MAKIASFVKKGALHSLTTEVENRGSTAETERSAMRQKLAMENWGPYGDCPVHWGDIMMEPYERVVTTPPPTTVTRSEISREEFLFRYYIDLVTDPCKYGSDLEEEKAETEAELQDLGKLADVLTHLIRLEEEKMMVAMERAAKEKEYAEKSAVLEKKRLEHALKIAAMKEAAVKALEEDKARVAAKLAARKVATVKSGNACHYFLNNGMPKPAKAGWEAGCGYHKEGKCPDIHPDESGWDAAVAKRIADGHRHSRRSGGDDARFWYGYPVSRDNAWRDGPRREVSDAVRAAGGGEPAPSKPKNRFAGLDDE